MTTRAKGLQGRLVTGLGKASAFTNLPWVEEQLIENLGIKPFPGTLNLQLQHARDQETWQDMQQTASYRISAPSADSCDALCHPVRLRGSITAVALFPLVEGYSPDLLELVSAVPLRETLDIVDNDLLEVEPVHPIDASCVIFDLDGTLLDTIEAFYVLAQRSGDEYGIVMDRNKVHHMLNHGKPYWETVLPDSTEDRAQVIEQLNQRARALWPEIMAEYAQVFDGVASTLHALKQAGFTLGIVTGSGQSSLELLYQAGVEGLFDAVVTGDEVKKRKPHPEGLELCLKKLGLTADKAVYVGDTSIDMQASRNAGMRGIAVLSGAGSSADLCTAGAQRIIPNHQKLAELVIKS